MFKHQPLVPVRYKEGIHGRGGVPARGVVGIPPSQGPDPRGPYEVKICFMALCTKEFLAVWQIFAP